MSPKRPCSRSRPHQDLSIAARRLQPAYRIAARVAALPQRPGPKIRPELAARWDQIFSRALTYITPSFRPMQLGEWNVPDVAPAAKGDGSWSCIAWIGIDGNTDVTRIGTLQLVSADANGNLSRNCYAFSEWWPHSWQAIPNFPVSFGDTLLGLICLDSATEAWFSLLNLTSGIHAGFTFNAPAGTLSQENQAEWILERPAINGTTVQLPNFGEIYFDSAMGGHGLDFLADGVRTQR